MSGAPSAVESSGKGSKNTAEESCTRASGSIYNHTWDNECKPSLLLCAMNLPRK